LHTNLIGTAFQQQMKFSTKNPAFDSLYNVIYGNKYERNIN